MSYSLKIKNLLHNLKSTTHTYSKVYSSSNISRNNDYINKDNLNNDDSCANIMKPYLHKRQKQKPNPVIGYKTQMNKMIIDYVPLYEYNNFKNNKKKFIFNNNFIYETNYENNKSKMSFQNNNNSSSQNNINIIDNTNNFYFSKYKRNDSSYNLLKEEKKLLQNKIKNINNDDTNKQLIFYSYHKNKNTEINDYKQRNIGIGEYQSLRYFSGNNSNKKKLSSYIIKDKSNEMESYNLMNSNNIPSLNFSSYNNKINFNNLSQLKKENYHTNNNSCKSVRMIKRQPFKSLYELIDEEKKEGIFSGLIDKNKNQYLKHQLLLRNYKRFDISNFDNKPNRFNNSNIGESSENFRERDNHSGGKIILALNENTSKRKNKSKRTCNTRKKSKNFNFYIILIQSIWRGYTLRKLIKITKELYLLIFPFVGKINKFINKYKKNYFNDFKLIIKRYFFQKKINNKNFPMNNKIKKGNPLSKKSNKFFKSENYLYKNNNINFSTSVNKEVNSKKYIYNKEIKNDYKVNDIKSLKINNIFYHKKKLPYDKNKMQNKIVKNIIKQKNSDSSILNKNNINNIFFSNKRIINRKSYKKFYNISPEYRNIELNINNSIKKSLQSIHLNKDKNINFQERNNNSLQNLVCINEIKSPKNNIKDDMFEKIKHKIFNNFYLTFIRCIKKSIYKYYFYKLKNNENYSSNFEKKKKALRNIINKIRKKRIKNYFRKYRENILVEKIKTKYLNFSDFSMSKPSSCNSGLNTISSSNNTKFQKIYDISLKFQRKKLINKYFSIWKMIIYNNFIKVNLPKSSSRRKLPSNNAQSYIKKMISYKTEDFKDININRKVLITKDNNFLKKYTRSPTNTYLAKTHQIIKKSPSPNNKIALTKINKKISNNQSLKPNSNCYSYYAKYFYFSQNELSFLSNLKLIFDKINNKNLVYKYFNIWKSKSTNIIIYNKTKFIKFFLLFLKNFLNEAKPKMKDIIRIGMSMFIWYKNTFKVIKREKIKNKI